MGEHERTSDQLLRESQSGDGAALTQLIDRHYPMLRAFIRLRVDAATRARESVSDLVQSVCREVLIRAERFEYRGEAAFRGWLCEAALRKLKDRRDYHLAQKRDPRMEQPPNGDESWAELAGVYQTTLDPVGKVVRMEELERLERAFDALGQEMRQALTLRQICDVPYAEIAREMERSEEAVRKLVSRARARLAEKLAEDSAGE